MQKIEASSEQIQEALKMHENFLGELESTILYQEEHGEKLSQAFPDCNDYIEEGQDQYRLLRNKVKDQKRDIRNFKDNQEGNPKNWVRNKRLLEKLVDQMTRDILKIIGVQE